MFKEVKWNQLNITSPDLVVVRVNSDAAREWLKLNTGNRRIRKTLVEYLKRQIKTGEWQSNHPQPVVFSDAGRLIDGQHRLTAIAESEVYNGSSVYLRVETGASDSIREYMDTGITRTLDDRVELESDSVLNKFASQIISAHLSLVTGKDKRYGKATPQDAREFYELHSVAVRNVFERHRRERGTGAMPVAVAAMEYFEKNYELADEFYTDLFRPAGEVQQSQMLRDFLLRMQVGGSYVHRKEQYLKAVSCMKAHMEGRLVGKVVRAANW
jgi:hypothetical protein